MSGAIPERPAVLDATALSNFAFLDRIADLQTLPRPITTPAVRDEITAGAESYPFTGSIGVLIELVESDELDEQTADALLKRLIDRTDYRAPSPNLSDYR